MRKKAFALILLGLLLTDCTNNEIKKSLKESNKETSYILKDYIKKLEKNSQSQALIEKYNLKGEFNDEAIDKIRKLAFELYIPEEWIYKLFDKESKGNPQAINKITGATGLIQIMPSTARNLGTTVEDLHKMNVSEQLYWIELYLKKVKKNKSFNSFHDLYFAVFYPLAINKPKDYVLGMHISEDFARKVARQNKGIDKAGDGDGLLSVNDVLLWLS